MVKGRQTIECPECGHAFRRESERRWFHCGKCGHDWYDDLADEPPDWWPED